MKRLAVSLLVLCASACDKAPPPDATQAPDKPTSEAKAPAASGADDGAVAAAGERPQDSAQPAEVGKPAPDFALPDLDGKTHTLADYKGKTVVLEWFNPECPFVNYAHGEGPLKAMAADKIKEGIVWLAINSGAPGMQGQDPAVNKTKVAEFGMTHPVLLDPDGKVGHLYAAEKTPHMFVIDGAGTLQYAGGLDNAPFGEVDGDGPRQAYLDDALTAVLAGDAVATPTAKAWGCTVKYAKG